MNKDIEYVLLDKEKINTAVKDMAQKISRDYEGKNLLLVGLLKGSVVFMSDLMREISVPLNIDFMCVSSYGAASVSSGEVRILKDLSASVDDTHILLVEDIIDSGNTLEYIAKYLKNRGAESIKICTLLSKPSRRVADIPIDYLGYEIPDEFVVGYGLDFNENYRNLPYIGVLKRSVYL